MIDYIMKYELLISLSLEVLTVSVCEEPCLHWCLSLCPLSIGGAAPIYSPWRQDRLACLLLISELEMCLLLTEEPLLPVPASCGVGYEISSIIR